jgi:hypothetical protein
MSAQNASATKWLRAQGTYVNSKSTVTGNQAVLHTIIIGTYTNGGKFRLANGTLTNIVNYITGTFVPLSTGIQPPLDFKELEFANGIYVETAGTIDMTLVYNELV